MSGCSNVNVREAVLEPFVPCDARQREAQCCSGMLRHAPAFSDILRHSPARLQPSLLKGPSTGPFSLVPSILPLMKQQSKETSSSPDTREQVYGRTRATPLKTQIVTVEDLRLVVCWPLSRPFCLRTDANDGRSVPHAQNRRV